MPELSVVIPTRRREQTLLRTLEHLSRQTAPPTRFEVIVVREDSDPGICVAEQRTWPFRSRWLRVDRAGGASVKRNVGWGAAGAPLVLFLGDDILAAPQLVERHLEQHRHNPGVEVGVLGHVSWARELRITPFMRWLEHGIQFDYGGIADGADSGWWRFYTANASVKRALLHRAGGFDEQCFPFMYEDIDLAARMAEHGFRLVYDPQAAGEHLHPQDPADWLERIELVARAERRFVRRYPHARAYYHDMFTAARAHPRARGRGARLAAIVPSRTPWIGPRVWASLDMRWRQALGARFLDAWDAEDDHRSGP
jgi:GT2 family glycosyltransferase